MEYQRLSSLLDNDIVQIVTPSFKLQSYEIITTGNTPVVSQEKSFINGYTNRIDDRLIDTPFIIFGDHTECLKFIDFPFVQGADGIKILKANAQKLNPHYLYYALCECYHRTGFYERHFKLLKKTLVPKLDMDVQQRIANILSVYDDLIEKNNRKIEILQEIAEELYKEWFVRFRFPGYNTAKFENGIPKDWGVDKIKNKVNRLPFNKLYKEADLEKEGNVIVIDQSEKEYLGFHNNEPSHVASIDEPICLFGDHSCKFQLMSEPFSLGENVVPFKGLGVNSYYLFYATYHIIETEEYKRHWGLFTSKKIFIPPEPLQDKFAEFIKDIQQQTNTIIKCQRLLIKQRDLLLPRLMSGKLEVKVK